MKKNSVQKNQHHKINNYLKQFPVVKSNHLQIQKSSSLQTKLNQRLKTKNRSQIDNRSTSEIQRNLLSLQITPNRWKMTPTVQNNSTKNNPKLKLPKLQLEQQNDLLTEKKNQKLKESKNAVSMTLQFTKKKKLLPLKAEKYNSFWKTKAGTNGPNPKINQDIVIIQTKLPFGLKLFCVCDGHGLNGHNVSLFIKTNLAKNLNKLLKKQIQLENIVNLIQKALEITNNQLLISQINTDLSGSTLIAVFIYKNIIYSFNVGDSRAILVSRAQDIWKSTPLSIDQKPDRQDQKQRIIKFGGRIQAQKDFHGNQIGPSRVWMANIQMPGLAMTRSFGDKAGIKAGTNAIPEVIQHQIKPEDKFIIIASDGVWEYVENDQLMQILVPFYEKNILQLGCERVINYCTAIWRKICLSRDDITLIVVSINDE